MKLIIDSRDRLSGSNSSDFTITLPQVISGREFSLEYVQFPVTFYNIRTGVNDRVVWNRGADFSYQVPAGSYSIDTLMTVIAAGMNAADANNYTITQSATTLKLTFSGTSAFSFTWGASSGTLWRELGFLQVNTASATSVTTPNVYQLYLPNTVFVDISELSKNATSTTANDRATFVVPIDQNAKELVTFSASEKFGQVVRYQSKISLQSINVRLRFRNNEQVDLNGAEWTMILNVE